MPLGPLQSGFVVSLSEGDTYYRYYEGGLVLPQPTASSAAAGRYDVIGSASDR